MNAAIITIAGLSSRFNKGIPLAEHKLKAIYHEGDARETLLFHMLQRLDTMDRIILVSGYRHEDLMEYVENVLPAEMKSRVIVVKNDHYEDWSSGYSLYLGIKEALCLKPDTVLFAEGDLDVDEASFADLVSSDKNVITYNHNLIHSNKAVIGYLNAEGKYKYSFNTTHGLASINEPFHTLFNSGQIWKFTNMKFLEEANDRFESVKSTGTNLIIIADYFENVATDSIALKGFEYWVNCNTREDYRAILKKWEVKE